MSENYMEQSVPFAEEAEAGIISAMFKDREVIQDIVQLVRDTDFYKPENAILLRPSWKLTRAVSLSISAP